MSLYRTRAGRAAAALLAAGVLSTVAPASGAAAATAPRIDLTVLVVDDGGGAVEAIVAELKGIGVPYRTLRLDDPARPTVNAAFLSDTVGGRPRAKFQGVVVPDEDPFGASSAAGAAENEALFAYEKTFGIRQVDAYTWAHPGVGLEYTDNGGYAGVLDGAKARSPRRGRRPGHLSGTSAGRSPSRTTPR